MTRESKDEKPATLHRILDIGATDLTQRALAGQLARAYGRDAEVEKVFHSLQRKRSVLLLGPADVGKTAILHEAVQRMARRQCPDELAGRWVTAVSTGAVLAGTHYLGEWQTRLTELLDAVKDGKTVYLYFEDIWGLRDAGRASDKADGFATLIRPYLERGDLQLLGETTPDNFNGSKYEARALADEPSFMKQFDVITVEEPTLEATKSILTQVAKGLRQGGTVRIETSAVERALELTRRYLPYQAFPGKATRLLGESAHAAATHGIPLAPGAERVVNADAVTASFSRLTGLPDKILSDAIGLRQEEIRAYFDERVIGQEEAISAVADVVTLIKAEMNDPARPLGVLFFVGPTGVGKTELAKTLAEYLFGSKDKLIRLDMSEYKSPLSISDLLQQLTEKQRRQTFSVLLLDEIEKASPLVFDLFLQVFGDGRLTDASGRSVDLHNTIIIMTSNLGNQVSETRASSGNIGFISPTGAELVDAAAVRRREVRRVLREVEEYFRPEFINRLDKIVVFQPLALEDMRRIARRELGRALVREGVVRRNILIDFQDPVLEVLLDAGFSPQYGARPLQRAIRDLVLLPLARTIAAQPGIGEQLLELVERDGRIDTEIIPLAAPGESAAPEEPEELRERLPVVEASSGRTRSMDARQLEQAIEGQRERIEVLIASERYETLGATSQALLEEMGRPTFWDDQERSRQTLSEIYQIDRVTSRLKDLRNRAEGMAEAARMIRRHGDVAGLARLAQSYEQLEREVALAEMELLAGEPEAMGPETVFVCITPQPTVKAPDKNPEYAQEAADWARQVQEMYLGWARRKGYDAEAIADDGDPVLALRGPNLSRMLLGEVGLHKLQRDDGDAPRGRGRANTRVFLARVEILPAPRADGAEEGANGRAGAESVPAGVQVRVLGAAGETPGRDGRDGKEGRESRDGRDGRTRLVAEATHAPTGLTVRVRAAEAERLALALLAARLACHSNQGSQSHPSSVGADEVVRLYHLGKTQYVRDKRTGERDGQPRRVLGGGIDRFLLAYLQSATSSEPGSEPGSGNGRAKRER
jgi:ATP-dependent Clp protease ATP-binding subunit ClpA